MSLSKCLTTDYTSRRKNLIDFRRDIYEPDLTYGRALRTVIITSVERSYKHYEYTKFPSALVIWLVPVPSEVDNYIVIPQIRIEGATVRKFYQLFHTCLERNIGSCRVSEFCGC